MKTYLELTDDEREERKKLTPQEKAAVDAFIAAAKALPKTISLELNPNNWGEPNLQVYKQITKGSASCVAELRKKSLCF